MDKIYRYLANLREPALHQLIRFVLEAPTQDDIIQNVLFIKQQVNEFNKMYSDTAL